MKKFCICLATAAAAAYSFNAAAQPPDEGRDADPPRGERGEGDRPDGDRPEGDREGGRRGGRDGRGGGFGFGGPGGPGGFRMPPSPVMAALDTDQDGELSEEEINGAVAALKKLDKNNDKKLAGDEIRPQFGPGGPGGPRPDPAQMVERMMQGDADKDGKLSKEEMPEWLRDDERFGRLDTNSDGFADKAEIEAMTSRFGGPGGPGGRGPGGPGGPGGRERNREGDRPQRDTEVSPDDL